MASRWGTDVVSSRQHRIIVSVELQHSSISEGIRHEDERTVTGGLAGVVGAT